MIVVLIIAVVAAALVAAAIGLSPRYSPKLYRKLVFAPVKASIGAYKAPTLNGITAYDVNFRFPGGEQLHAQHWQTPDAKVTVLLSHSNWGNINEWQRLIEQLLRCGVSVFAYDYRGFGQSEGTPTTAGVCRDGLDAFDYLVVACHLNPTSIVLYGSSLGSGVSSYIASRRNAGGIILHGAFTSLRELSIDLMPLVRKVPESLFFTPAMNNCFLLPQLNMPLLVLHGAHDEICAMEKHAKRLFECGRTKHKWLVILPNSSHMDVTTDGKLFIESVSAFAQTVASKEKS
jgi:pimeloyl-ACP methyl ester carboxylesterase